MKISHSYTKDVYTWIPQTFSLLKPVNAPSDYEENEKKWLEQKVDILKKMKYYNGANKNRNVRLEGNVVYYDALYISEEDVTEYIDTDSISELIKFIKENGCDGFFEGEDNKWEIGNVYYD
jgi:hypothetical protein